MGGNRGVGRPVFDVHFVMITANPDAHAAITESKCRSAVYYLNQEFRSLSGEQVADFRFKSFTPYSVASTTGCDAILAYGDITGDGQDSFNLFCKAVNACNDKPLVKDPNAINCYIFDQGGWEDDDDDEATPDVWTMSNQCCNGRSNGYKPILRFDWARLISRSQAPEAHEMGHGFGLQHVCIPDAHWSDSTNIMGSKHEEFIGSGGLRDMGFTEAQVAIIEHCARNTHVAPFGIVVRGLEGRDTHTAGSSSGHIITFYLQNLGGAVGRVQAFANGTLLQTFHGLAEGEDRSLTVVGANRVVLKAYCGSMYDEEIVHFDDNPPTFERIDVFPNPNQDPNQDPAERRRRVLSAHGVRDDGDWNTNDYEVHVVLDGITLEPKPGFSILTDPLSIGQHRATMQIADGAGLLSEARSITFNVDVGGPSLRVLSPAENGTVRPGGNLQIAIEAEAADGIQIVKLFLDRISEDEFDYTSLGVFPGTFGVGTPERREKTVTANWSIGTHKLIAVATGHSGETTTVERTFSVSLDLPDGLWPGGLPDRQQRYIRDPRQTILPTETRIVPPRQGRDEQSRQDQSGSTFQMRHKPTRIFPTWQNRQQGTTKPDAGGSRQQSSQSSFQRLQPSNRLHTLQQDRRQGLQLPTSVTRQQGATNTASGGSRQQSSQSGFQRLQPSQRLHTLQQDGRQGLRLPTSVTRQQGTTNPASAGSQQQSSQSRFQGFQPSQRINAGQEERREELQLPTSMTRQRVNGASARSSFDRRKVQPVNGKAQVKTEPGKTEASGNSGVQGRQSSPASAAAILQRTAPLSHKKNKSEAKFKLNQAKTDKSGSDEEGSSETDREPKPESLRLRHTMTSASTRRSR
jgi:hypothetical protein